MNRYPRWLYSLIALAVLAAALYTVPNFFGEAPAIQVASAKTTVKLDSSIGDRIEAALKAEGIQSTAMTVDQDSARIRLVDIDAQLKARDALSKALNPDPADPTYVIALNFLPASPAWMSAVGAKPMNLGLDLRGGVHFLLQVDMQAALVKRLESFAGDLRTLLRDKEIRHAGVARERSELRIRFRDAATRDKAEQAIASQQPALDLVRRDDGRDQILVATLKPDGDAPLGSVWRDTRIAVPEDAPRCYRQAFTGACAAVIEKDGRQWIRAADAFEHFPIAFLETA